MSELSYNKYAADQEYEEINSNFSPMIKPIDFNIDMISYSQDRQLIPHKSVDTDSSCQENCCGCQPLFYLNFSEARSIDMSIPSGDTRLFGQLHRLQDNFGFFKTDIPELHAKNDAAVNSQQMLSLGWDTCVSNKDSQTALDQLVPILYCRKPLPLLEFERTPVYVNSKQYDRVLKLRNKKLEKGAIKGPNYIFERPKSKTYLHESRSKHAKNRNRLENGRFVAKRSDDNCESREILSERTYLCPKIKRPHT